MVRTLGYKRNVVLQKVATIGAAVVGTIVSTVGAFSKDAFDMAGDAITTTQDKAVAIAKKLMPLALVVCIIAILVSHDERAMAIEKKIALTICVAYIALLLISNGAVQNTLDSLIK